MTAGSLLPDPPARGGDASARAARVSRVSPFSVTLNNYYTATYEYRATWAGVGAVPARGTSVLAIIDDQDPPAVWVIAASPPP